MSTSMCIKLDAGFIWVGLHIRVCRLDNRIYHIKPTKNRGALISASRFESQDLIISNLKRRLLSHLLIITSIVGVVESELGDLFFISLPRQGISSMGGLGEGLF